MLSGNDDFIRKLTREELCSSIAKVDPTLSVSPTSSKDTIRTCARLLRESGANGSRAAELEGALKDEKMQCDAAESRARSLAEREARALSQLADKTARWNRQRKWLILSIACLFLVVACLLFVIKALREQNDAMYYDVVLALEDPRRAGKALAATGAAPCLGRSRQGPPASYFNYRS
jgi:hypothetical protein